MKTHALLTLVTAVVGAALLISTSSFSPASAASVYTAHLGANSANGTATISGTKLSLAARALTAGTWSESLYRGTCLKRGTRIAALPTLSVPATGRVSRSNTLTSSVAALAATGALWLTRGTKTVCGGFSLTVVKVAASPSTSRSPTATPSGAASPTPTATATASPSSSPEDDSPCHAAGQQVCLGDPVAGLFPGASATVDSAEVATVPGETPPADQVFLTVHVTIVVAASAPTAVDLTQLTWFIQLDANHPGILQSSAQRTPALSTIVAQPGQTVAGWLTFQVPRTSHPRYVLGLADHFGYAVRLY